MRILHTSDWHVGKTLKGRSRLAEHAQILDRIIGVARERDVHLVVISGDTFDTAAPSAEAEKLTWRALQQLSQVAPVVLLAGNHDGPVRFDAVAQLLELTNVHVASTVQPPAQGGVRTIDTAAGPAKVALVPWLSQRYVVSAQQLMDLDPEEYESTFAARTRAIVEALCGGMDDDTVNVLAGHLTVVGRGGITLGGGERVAQTVLDYHLAPDVFPLALDYVALGHIHRAQTLTGPTTIRYAGSPMSLDFGEAGRDPKGVDIVEVEPGRPAKVESVPLGGKPLLTLSGTVSELVAQYNGLDVDAHLRLRVAEPPRHGLADELRTQIPAAVEIRVDAAHDPSKATLSGVEQLDQDPAELFGEYLEQAGLDGRDEITARFGELLERVTAPCSAAGPSSSDTQEA